MSYQYRTTPHYQTPSPSSWHKCMHTHPSITICSKNGLHQMTLLTDHLLNPPPTILTDHIFSTLSAPFLHPTIDWSHCLPLVRSTSETGGIPHTPTAPDPSLPCDCQYTAWTPHELSNHSVWTTARTWGKGKLKKKWIQIILVIGESLFIILHFFHYVISNNWTIFFSKCHKKNASFLC